MKRCEVKGVRRRDPTGLLDRGLSGAVRRAVWPVLAFGLVTAGGLVAVGQSPKAPENQVKTLFLCNFPEFVTWPTNTFSSDNAPLVIGVLGEDPFGPVLDQAVKNRKVQNRNLIVKRCKDLVEIKGCHLLFVSASESRRLKEVMAVAERSAVLTVGDTAQFARRGGVINLTIQENKVRFEINPDAANRAGLRISAQLLKLGKVVGDEPADLKQ
jgi:hypothetical protein